MRSAILKRTFSDDLGTFGILILDNCLSFVTAELPWRDLNADGVSDANISRIPPGTYLCQWALSPKYGYYRYRLAGVNGREGILIHAGNHVGDKKKGLRCDAAGCILLGRKIGAPEGQKGLVESRDALLAFEKEMARQPFRLTIVDAFT